MTGSASIVNGALVLLPGSSTQNSVSVLNVDGHSGGTYSLTIRYSSSGASPTKDLYVNGVHVAALTFTNTGDWNTFATLTISITLNAGTSNTIGIADRTGGLGVEFDWFQV